MTEPSFKCAIEKGVRAGPRCKAECPHCRAGRTGESGPVRVPLCYEGVSRDRMPEALRRALERQEPQVFRLPDLRERVTRL